MNAYSLKDKVQNGYIYARVTKDIYGLPQPGRIAQDSLAQHLSPHVYHPKKITPGLWTYDSRHINFTLVVDNFGIKYSGKEHTLPLNIALEAKYKVTTDWYQNIYAVVSINWDYDKGTVQLSMPGYVCAALHYFQHENPKIAQD